MNLNISNSINSDINDNADDKDNTINNIDFFSELNNINNLDDEDIDDTNNKCLIYYNDLTHNYITLSCGHKFNYLPLFKEVFTQKRYRGYNNYLRLRTSQFICPYCRTLQNKLLPYIPILKNEKIYGINSPFAYCMKHKTCQYVFKTGKNKNNVCGDSGFSSVYGDYCKIHYNKMVAAKIKNDNKINIKIKNKENLIEWNEQMEEFSKKHTIPMIKNLLKEKKLKLSGNKKQLIMRLFI